MTEQSASGMMAHLERQDADEDKIKIPVGVTSFGRGPFLKCKEKKVSRNHGLLELLPNGQVFITSIHSTPLFVRAGAAEKPRPLIQNQRERLHPGDEFCLLLDSFCYKLCQPAGDVATAADQGHAAEPAQAAAGTSAIDTDGPADVDGGGEALLPVTPDRAGVVAEEAPAAAAAAAASAAPEATAADGASLSGGSGRQSAAAAAAAAASVNGSGASSSLSGPAAQRHAPALEQDTNQVATNGVARKFRQLPAWLLKPSAEPAANASGGSSRKRPAPSGAGSASSGEKKKRAAGGGAASPRGKKQQARARPAGRRQLSMSDSDDETPPSPVGRVGGDGLGEASGPAPPKSAATGPARADQPPSPRPTPADPPAAGSESAAPDASALGAAAATSSATPRRKVAVHGGAPALSDEESEGSGPATAVVSSSQRESCGFGAQCFRKNAAHGVELAHPGDADYAAPPDPAAGGPLPECEFGRRCYRKNPQHRHAFTHTSRPNPGREAKRKARRRAQQPADTPDSYDLDDEFINDTDSDDYAPDESGSDWSADEGSGSDEDDRRRLAREARRITGGAR